MPPLNRTKGLSFQCRMANRLSDKQLCMLFLKHERVEV